MTRGTLPNQMTHKNRHVRVHQNSFTFDSLVRQVWPPHLTFLTESQAGKSPINQFYSDVDNVLQGCMVVIVHQ